MSLLFFVELANLFVLLQFPFSSVQEEEEDEDEMVDGVPANKQTRLWKMLSAAKAARGKGGKVQTKRPKLNIMSQMQLVVAHDSVHEDEEEDEDEEHAFETKKKMKGRAGSSSTKRGVVSKTSSKTSRNAKLV